MLIAVTPGHLVWFPQGDKEKVAIIRNVIVTVDGQLVSDWA
jgi:hypothetical protein